jgi:hypothetical protein
MNKVESYIKKNKFFAFIDFIFKFSKVQIDFKSEQLRFGSEIEQSRINLTPKDF